MRFRIYKNSIKNDSINLSKTIEISSFNHEEKRFDVSIVDELLKEIN